MSNYATSAEADTYFEAHMFATPWTSATDANKTKALTHATRIINNLSFIGDKTASDQANEFPRGGDTAVPTGIKVACYEIALALLDGIDPAKEYEKFMIEREQFGPMSIGYRQHVAAAHIIAGVPSVVAWQYLLPYLRDDWSFKLQRSS